MLRGGSTGGGSGGAKVRGTWSRVCEDNKAHMREVINPFIPPPLSAPVLPQLLALHLLLITLLSPAAVTPLFVPPLSRCCPPSSSPPLFPNLYSYPPRPAKPPPSPHLSLSIAHPKMHRGRAVSCEPTAILTPGDLFFSHLFRTANTHFSSRTDQRSGGGVLSSLLHSGPILEFIGHALQPP